MVKPDRSAAEPRGEINVTPLVDVCLVLLIIFMVVTPMLNHRADIDVPSVARPGALPEPEKQVVLAMKWPDRTTWYEESWLPAKEMLGRLRELRARSSGKEVVLVADARLPYGDVKRVMTIVREAGFGGMSLVARKEAASKR